MDVASWIQRNHRNLLNHDIVGRGIQEAVWATSASISPYIELLAKHRAAESSLHTGRLDRTITTESHSSFLRSFFCQGESIEMRGKRERSGGGRGGGGGEHTLIEGRSTGGGMLYI